MANLVTYPFVYCTVTGLFHVKQIQPKWRRGFVFVSLTYAAMSNAGSMRKIREILKQ